MGIGPRGVSYIQYVITNAMAGRTTLRSVSVLPYTLSGGYAEPLPRPGEAVRLVAPGARDDHFQQPGKTCLRF